MPFTFSLALYLTITIYFQRFFLIRVIKTFFLIFVLGDYFSSGFWTGIAAYVYGYINQVTDSMRETGNLLLLVGFILIDVGYLVMHRGFNKAVVKERELVVSKLQLRILFYVLLTIKVVTTLVIIKVKGSVSGIFSLQPEDTTSLSFLIGVFDFFFPAYLALRTFHRFQQNAVLTDTHVFIDLLLMVSMSLLSHSKAAVLIYLYIYCSSMILLYGKRFLGKLFNVKGFVLLMLLIMVIGIKTQLRSKSTQVNTSSIVTEFIGGTSSRFLGGVHRTYLYTTDKLLKNESLEFGGKYLTQFLYLWVPRAIWSEKPNVQSEKLYYLLDIEQEEYGTSFAINLFGCMILDFGIIGLLIQSLLFGLGLAYIDHAINRKKVLTFFTFFFILILFNSLLPLIEAGIPMAIISVLLQFILLSFIVVLGKVTIQAVK